MISIAAIQPYSGPVAAISAMDFVNLALFGIFNMGLALYLVGAKYLPAAEAALLSILETPFATLWGGAMMLIAVLWQILGDVRRGRG